MTVDDDGTPCAGFRSCSSVTGVSDSGDPNATWNAPLELRCAQDKNLTRWGPPDYLFPVYFARGLPYDPPRPWKDFDGQWYAAISTDGCNYTHSETKKNGCDKGGQLQIYTSPRLHGMGSDWKYIGPMITTSSLPGNGRAYCEMPRGGCHVEFVTSGYIGAIPGDPRGGLTRVVTANQAPGNPSSTVYYIGLQANGSRFLDGQGKNEFSGAGEIGMVDWGAWRPAGNKSGVAGLSPVGGYAGGFTMARTLGSGANQVATPGRRVIVAWLSSMFKINATAEFKLNCQSLPQELSLGLGSAGEVVLKQAFVPELSVLRLAVVAFPSTRPATNVAGQQVEIVATMAAKASSVDGTVSLDVLLDPADAGSYSTVGVDFKRSLVYVDGTR
eukprot:SAG31_NODE_7147_length_1776_cov_1.202743_1_plen_384_part_10